MNTCIFCKIVDKTISSPGIFWENETHLAMLSINPNTLGFTVVLPKKHLSSDVMELEHNDLSELMIASKEVSKILKNYFPDVGRVGVITEGLGVDHAHVKLFPMHGTSELKKQWRSYDTDKTFWFDTFEGWMSSGPGPDANLDELSQLASDIKKTIR